jgi:hypothetical protein
LSQVDRPFSNFFRDRPKPLIPIFSYRFKQFFRHIKLLPLPLQAAEIAKMDWSLEESEIAA